MNPERRHDEEAYVEDLTTHIRHHGAGLSSPMDFVRHEVVGSWPDTEVRILFRAPRRGPCLYGVRDRIWDEDPISEFGVERAVTYTWQRIAELVEADPSELPARCTADDAGVTWVELWPGNDG